MRRYGYLLLVGVFSLWGCNNPQASKDAAKDTPKSPKDNYIVLLDLGDRILFNNQQQVPKDIEVIKSIYGIFKSKLDIKDTSREYYTLTDKLKLLGAPNWFYASVDLSAEQPDKRASMPEKMEKTFNTLLPEIYKGAITGNNGTAYSGADIWKYFNEHLTDDLDKDGQNTLFIVTDGYMGLKKSETRPAQKNRYASSTQIIDALKNDPDWETKFNKGDYGLISTSKKFTNLRVIVVQVNPKEGWSGEYSLLAKIWDKWFTEMGITNYSLIKDDSTNEVIKSLGKLMNVKMDSSAHQQWTKISTTDSSRAADLTTERKTTDAPKKTAAEPSAPDKPVANLTDSKKTDNTPVKKDLPILVKSTTANVRPSSAATSAEKKTAVAPKKKIPSTPEVIPPDESDTRVLNIKKAPAKKAGTKNEDDILQDDGAANGFNTGIKKDNKKKDQ